MTNNAAYTREYLDIIESLDGDAAGRRAAQSYMQNSTAIVHGNHVASSYVPRFFDQATYDRMKFLAETTYSMTAKVMQHYLDDPSYRGIFDYDPRLVDLILMPRGYDEILPFARIDVFLNEETLACGFCELNSDGSSGMNEDREQNASFSGSSAMREFAKRHTLSTSDLFEPWVDEFLRIYSTFEGRVEHPHIAVVDFLGPGAITAEFQAYCKRFTQRGFEADIADVRDLTYKNGVLRDATGRRIDAIWRRCVTSDVLDNWEESQPLIQAVADGTVALIGSFAGHIPHDKQIFDAFHHPTTQEFLTPEEIDVISTCVPTTKFLDDEHIDLNDVRSRKDAWIIKPPDRYGATDVYAGCMYSQDEWEQIVSRFANGAAGAPFLVQTYLQTYATDFILPRGDLLSFDEDTMPLDIVPMNNMSGLYLFSGRFSGVFSRMGEKAIISEGAGSRHSAATIWVDCEL